MSDSVTKAATGLAFIIPGIFLVRWLLSRKVGSPEQWAERHIAELKQRFARGDIDEEQYKKRLEELSQD